MRQLNHSASAIRPASKSTRSKYSAYGAGSKQEISTLRNRTLGRSRRRQLLSLLIQIKRKLKRRRKQKRNG